MAECYLIPFSGGCGTARTRETPLLEGLGSMSVKLSFGRAPPGRESCTTRECTVPFSGAAAWMAYGVGPPLLLRRLRPVSAAGGRMIRLVCEPDASLAWRIDRVGHF
jgi:hypothetical protein